MAIQSDRIKDLKVGLERKLAESIDELVRSFEVETGIIVEKVILDIENYCPDGIIKEFSVEFRLDL